MTEAGVSSKLNPASAAFALAAAICMVANTAIACAKDASQPLKSWMASLTGHDWTTQGIAVVVLFFALGFALQRTSFARTVAPHRIIALVVGAAVVSGLGLFAWYALY